MLLEVLESMNYQNAQEMLYFIIFIVVQQFNSIVLY